MSVIARAAAIALIGVLALATTACTNPAPDPTPTTPQTTPAPIFTTDEQALAAAQTAYAAYNKAANTIGVNGGNGVEALEPLVDEDLLAQSRDEFAQFAASGLHIAGETVIVNMRLVEQSQQKDVATVSTYLCRDVSAVRVLNMAGEDVTPAGRQDRQALVATFSSTKPGSSVLLVSGLQEWTGDGVC